MKTVIAIALILSGCSMPYKYVPYDYDKTDGELRFYDRGHAHKPKPSK